MQLKACTVAFRASASISVRKLVEQPQGPEAEPIGASVRRRWSSLSRLA
jgi:hypothetical protein